MMFKNIILINKKYIHVYILYIIYNNQRILYINYEFKYILF